MVDDVDKAVDFYTTHFGFTLRSDFAPAFADVVRGSETVGHVTVSELVVPRHTAGRALHTHDFDEAFHLLEGELIFQVAEALVTNGAGELSFAPRNRPRALANHSDAPARYLLI